jgi:hypothetical protein
VISLLEPKRTHPVPEHRRVVTAAKKETSIQSASDSTAHQSPIVQIEARRQRLDELYEAIEHSDDVATLYALANEAERVADQIVAAIRATPTRAG